MSSQPASLAEASAGLVGPLAAGGGVCEAPIIRHDNPPQKYRVYRISAYNLMQVITHTCVTKPFTHQPTLITAMTTNHDHDATTSNYFHKSHTFAFAIPVNLKRTLHHELIKSPFMPTGVLTPCLITDGNPVTCPPVIE